VLGRRFIVYGGFPGKGCLGPRLKGHDSNERQIGPEEDANPVLSRGEGRELLMGPLS